MSPAALINTLPCLRAESWSREPRRPVRLGLVRSKERRASVDQSRTKPGLATQPRKLDADPVSGACGRISRAAPRLACRLDGVTFAGIVSRTMSLPGEVERQRLDWIADDLREAFNERGHRVDVALDADPAFGSGLSRNALMRDLVMDTVALAASQAGISFKPVNGSGRELAGEMHRYRIRRAKADSTGVPIIAISSESSLVLEEEPSLFPMENWVFGWISDADGLIADIFVAEVCGIRPGTPGQLILGSIVPLGTDGPVGDGFTPTNEELDLGLDEDGDLDEGEEGGLGA
jgi:hypothetical protein